MSEAGNASSIASNCSQVENAFCRRKNVPVRNPIACPGAAQREALSAFTRVHSPSKTGVNALKDALWRNGALQTPISGLPEIGA